MLTQSTFTYSKLTVETLEQSCEICSKLIVNFEHISHPCSSASVFNFEQVNAGWVQLWTKHLEQSKEIRSHWAGLENFDIFFCVLSP